MEIDPKQNQSKEIKKIIEEETKSKFGRESAVAKYLMDDQPNVKLNSTTLGVDFEKVLYSYTFDELNKPKIYEKIDHQLQEKSVNRIVIHSDITVEGIERVMKQAEKYDIPFTIVKAPEFKGDIGLELLK